MKRIVNGLITLACVCALAFVVGCGDKEEAKSSEGSAKAGGGGPAAEFNAVADKVCACDNMDCALAAMKEGRDVGKKLREQYKSESDVPKDVMEASESSRKRANKCVRDLRSGGGGSKSRSPRKSGFGKSATGMPGKGGFGKSGMPSKDAFKTAVSK